MAPRGVALCSPVHNLGDVSPWLANVYRTRSLETCLFKGIDLFLKSCGVVRPSDLGRKSLEPYG